MPFETPGAVERGRAARRRRGDDLPRLQRGLFGDGDAVPRRARRCATRRSGSARLLLRLFPTEPEIMGLTALMLLQHARAAARFDADGAVVLLEDQDRSLWNRPDDRRRPGADRQGDAPSPPGPLSGAGGDRRAARARARRPEDTDWAQIDLLYATLERCSPRRS